MGEKVMLALLLTLITGLFFLIGVIVYKFIKNKNKITIISMACAMIVIIGLIFGDLIPHLLEIKKWWLIIFVIVGLLIILLIDKIVPHHHHDHHEYEEDKKEHQGYLEHIGLITIIALLLHNFIEGMALYSIAVSDLESGILMCIGISLHNLPFGFQVAHCNNKHNKFPIVLLVLSALIGGLLIRLFGDISHTVEGIVIALTLGMSLHLLIFELFKEVWSNIKKKETYYGIIIGILILIIINII